ncbi:hypothetical protein DL95DRAFT_446671 [Leptodontidium sp. 2 PMI_412]|nr:hypothetical protein BKA61DRAFT_51143 [Leptodontidium sp. MPI-SDFR-AT-0119]KAH9214138.1 hypothetical protein DL95DRAFT_446671 [Leptodontidium sp. 2 PMI_412]
MPSRNLSFRQNDSNGVTITPRGLCNPDTNVFDKAFNEGLGLEEWDEWMKWESATTELLPTSIENNENLESSTSSPDTWAMGLESSGVNMSTKYDAVTEFPFADAPFELEDTPPTSMGSVASRTAPSLYPDTASYPTQGQMQQEPRRSYRGFSSLTEAEERSLQDIAMPYQALSNIKIASAPTSPAESDSISPSPEPEVRTRKNNKRKSIDLGELPSNALCQSRKRGHNAIEKRYRTNLNAKIESLREGVPSLCGPNDNIGDEESDGEGDGKSSQQKYGKAAILMRALEYIQHLEKTTQRLGSEVDTLKTRVGAFEKLAMGGSIILNGNGMEAISRSVMTKSETLESIQSDFQQIQPKAKPVTGPATRRRGSRQTNAS